MNLELKKSTISGLILATCLIYAVSLGIRMNYGIVLHAFSFYADIPYEKMSLVIAVAEMVYGLAQPLFGIAALKRSNHFVLKVGIFLIFIGVAGSAFARGILLLTITLGITASAGTGALSFGIIMGTVSPVLGSKRASAASGIINASSGIGSAALSPIAEWIFNSFGVTGGMLLLCLPVLLMFPVSSFIKKIALRFTLAADGVEERQAQISAVERVKTAMGDRNYRCLMIGFATCGFHMSLIQNHLYSQFVSYGIPEDSAALAYTMYGIITIAGALLSGFLCLRFSHKMVLGSIYASRILITVVFLFLVPKNAFFMAMFAGMLGLTGDATVTPTSEIISRTYGAESMGLLFGLTFVAHQCGSFISTWAAGILFQEAGSYQPIWCVDLALCALAATASFCIRERNKEAGQRNAL